MTVRARRAPEPVRTSKTRAAKAARTEAAREPDAVESAATDGDAFEKGDDPEQQKRAWWKRITQPQVTTKKAAHASSIVVAGVEIAVRVNHVDPLNDGRRDVRFNWVADGENHGVDLESVIARKQVKGLRMELQGPAVQARADGEALPLRARFVGVGFTTDVSGDMPHDPTPPRAELKLEVKLSDKSIASLAGLAGASAELDRVMTVVESSQAASVIGDVLLTAVPVVSGLVALVSARRAVRCVKDATAPLTTKALAVLRALADATTVVFPLVGTLANLALVGAAVVLARREAKRANPSTGPPADDA